MRVPAKPLPISKPFDAGSESSACARSASSLSKTGSPRPGGTPRATHSTTPPSESPRCARRVDRARSSAAPPRRPGSAPAFASTAVERHAARRRPSPRSSCTCCTHATHLDAGGVAQQLARDRARRDAADRLARAGAAAALPVADAVLRLGGVVGVRRAGTRPSSPRRRTGARPRCARAARSACRASGPRTRPTGSRRGRPPGAAS